MSNGTEGKSEKIMEVEGKVLWYPDSKRSTQMDKFRRQINGDYGLNLGERKTDAEKIRCVGFLPMKLRNYRRPATSECTRVGMLHAGMRVSVNGALGSDSPD